jgi:ATP-dependent Clp protease ATP-binding subunit ClpC
LIRIDMSEYMERHSVARLIGAPPGYVGYEEGGQLTERVRRHPYSVILLDEIEKAHPDVYNVLLQVVDDGRLTDGKGRVVDFTNTIIIATSNLGANLIQQNLIEGGQKSYIEIKTELMDVLRQHFRPEFLNRIDEIIVFHALSREQFREIVKLQLLHVKHTARGQGIELAFEDSLVNHLANSSYQPEYGARELRRRIKTAVENRLAKEILSGRISEGSDIAIGFEHGEVTFKKRTKTTRTASPKQKTDHK